MKIFRSPQIIISRNGAKEPEKSISLYDVQPPNDATKTFNFAELKNKQSIEIPVQNGSLRFTRVDESNVQMPADLMNIKYQFIPSKPSLMSRIPFSNVQGDPSLRLYNQGKGNNDKGQTLFPTHFPSLLVSRDEIFFLLENGAKPQVTNLLEQRFQYLTNGGTQDYLAPESSSDDDRNPHIIKLSSARETNVPSQKKAA